jgi:hypothetical protein
VVEVDCAVVEEEAVRVVEEGVKAVEVEICGSLLDSVLPPD